jgi:hypothetical protein
VVPLTTLLARADRLSADDLRDGRQISSVPADFIRAWLEVKTTGQLEHPSIVPVYGLARRNSTRRARRVSPT